MENALIWYRNDLRIQDHEALYTACNRHKKVLGVYFFDPRQFEKTKYGFRKTGKFRAKFLLESVNELRQNLSKLNIPLLVFHEKPEDRMAEIISKYEISDIYFQNEWTSEERSIEENLKKIAPNTEFHVFHQQFLFHPNDIPFKTEDVPEVFTQFRKICEKKVEVRDTIPTPALKEDNFNLKDEEDFPSLADFGLENFETDPRSTFPFKGGENQAWKRIQDYFRDAQNLLKYKKTRNGLIGTDYSSKLSAWLANGSISPRQIYNEVKKFEKKLKSNDSTYWLIFELIWRDYFKYISLKHGDKIFHVGGIKNRELEWNQSSEDFEKWKNAETKEDFVNANMKELAKTGFMSNRGRQNVNSFLAKELKHDWRKGAAYFESLLIDYDVHSNWGNWMYNSGVGNDPRDRKFNIKSQAERYDPENDYQNLWLKN